MQGWLFYFFLHLADLPVPHEVYLEGNLDIFYINFLLCYIPCFRKNTLIKYERNPLNVLFFVAKEN